MKDVKIETITQAFLDYCGEDTDPRTMFVLKKMVEHLHAFAIETQLSHSEWMRGLEFMYQAGEISTPERNEFVLASDVTGLSSLVDMIGSQHEGTSSSVLGPFHVTGAPEIPVGGDLKNDNDGATVVIEGLVRSTENIPIEGAVIELWQTATNGLYSNQDPVQNPFLIRLLMVASRYLLGNRTPRKLPFSLRRSGNSMSSWTKSSHAQATRRQLMSSVKS